MEELVGLEPGTRYRCGACGNLTRFDVETTERVTRFWHVDLGGQGRVDAVERTSVAIVAITCRWCGGRDSVEVVPALTAAGDERTG